MKCNKELLSKISIILSEDISNWTINKIRNELEDKRFNLSEQILNCDIDEELISLKNKYNTIVSVDDEFTELCIQELN